MNDAASLKTLSGIVPPMVTPLVDRNKLDRIGLERLIEHILAGGVSGLFLLGTTGEGPSLSHALRHELVDRTCALVAGRVRVLVGITDTSLTESIELAERARRAGADAVVAAVPYYFPLSQADVVAYYRRLAEATPLPLVLYNMPGCTKVALEVDTLRACSELPNIIGLKDSSGDLDFFRRVAQAMRDRPDFRLFIGPEHLLAEAVALGAHGGVHGGANVWPRLYVELYSAAVANDRAKLARLQANLSQIAEKIYAVGHDGSRIIRGIKTALACLGICSDVVAEPLQPLGARERELIGQNLDELEQVP